MAVLNSEKGLAEFEEALILLHEKKYKEALNIFKTLSTMEDIDATLINSVHVYESICKKRLEKKQIKLSSFEDFIDFTVFELNRGDIEKASKHLDKASGLDPENEVVFYLKAILQCRLANYENALILLEKAIEKDPINKIRARNDDDFSPLHEIDQFWKLVEQPE